MFNKFSVSFNFKEFFQLLTLETDTIQYKKFYIAWIMGIDFDQISVIFLYIDIL